MIYFEITRVFGTLIIAFSDPNEDTRQYCKMWEVDYPIWTDSAMKYTIQSIREFQGTQLTEEQVLSITGGHLPNWEQV